MALLEVFAAIIDFILDIISIKNFGPGNFLWKIAGVVCLGVAVFSFCVKLYILGVILVLGMIICFVVSNRRGARYFRQKHESKIQANTPAEE